MAAPYYSLERKVELAIQSALSSVDLDGVPVYIATDNQDETQEGEQGMQAPYVMVACSESTPDMPGQIDGVFVCPARLEVYTHRHDEPGETHAERTATVRDALIKDDIADTLSDAVSDFHCFYLRNHTLATENDGTHSISTLTLELICAASDL